MKRPDRETAIDLKVRLQSLGLRLEGSLTGRSGGAGPSDGVTVLLGDKVATVPTVGLYVDNSPFSLGRGGDGFEVLDKAGGAFPVEFADEPGFYSLETAGGLPYRKVALRHGRDAIGSTVLQTCAYGEDACGFCGIGLSLDSSKTTVRKTPEELAEVARAAEAEGYSHVVLTTGTPATPDRGIEHLVSCSREIKKATGMKVHVQFEPPADLSLIGKAADWADSVAINVECFDRRVLERVAPGKARTGLDEYRKAWSRAVEAFGRDQVTSFVIAGLGESEESVLEGCTELCSIGVYPFVLPLRPIKGSPMESASPPDPDVMMTLFEKVSEIVARAGLEASRCLAGCVRCGACSALPDITG